MDLTKQIISSNALGTAATFDAFYRQYGAGAMMRLSDYYFLDKEELFLNIYQSLMQKPPSEMDSGRASAICVREAKKLAEVFAEKASVSDPVQGGELKELLITALLKSRMFCNLTGIKLALRLPETEGVLFNVKAECLRNGNPESIIKLEEVPFIAFDGLLYKSSIGGHENIAVVLSLSARSKESDLTVSFFKDRLSCGCVCHGSRYPLERISLSPDWGSLEVVR